ncbi:hypothetical protein GJAV_G00206170 [Gymnothorax javanicus]|nr:hypothetical protein GJAV_G00206170 [Gymnothorax javanicus]
MKQQFSPGKENVREETSVHDAVELASPKSGGHEEAMDYPHVVVKLEDDDDDYSDSVTESDSEWMRPMEPVEDDEDENGMSRTKLSTPTFGKHVSPKQEFLEEMGKEESGTSHSSLKLKVDLKKVPKKKVTRKRKGSRQTRGKRVKIEWRKTKSSSKFSEGQVDAEGTGNERKTLSTVQRRTVKVKVKEPSVSPTRVPRSKRGRRSSLDGLTTEDGQYSRTSERNQAMGIFGAGILAPYSRLKAADAVSPPPQ